MYGLITIPCIEVASNVYSIKLALATIPRVIRIASSYEPSTITLSNYIRSS
jgi:hypothetical protein